MSEDRDIENKKNSMENFIEPDNNPLPGSDEASVFMKKRLLQHKKYLKTARGAQQAMEKISEKEAEAVCIAILLHDIGHGPFSHTLEKSFIAINHESLSLLFMQTLNEQFNGKLSLAIDIFKRLPLTLFYLK